LEFTFADIKSISELVSSVMVIVGIPLSVFKYWQSKNREKRESEYSTYDIVDDKYVAFQNLCFQFPKLDIGPTANATPITLNAEEKKQEMIAFTILLSLFERTYLMYASQSTRLKKNQWPGWEGYLKNYCCRENFQDAWKLYGYSYDATFQLYMGDLMKKCVLSAAQSGQGKR
jgi:hypothetical protein